MCVVVADQRVLLVDGLSHEVSQRDSTVEDRVVHESVGLLRLTVAVTVVAREGLEGADLMPPGAQLRGAVLSLESADVSSDEGDAEHVHHHATGD